MNLLGRINAMFRKPPLPKHLRTLKNIDEIMMVACQYRAGKALDAGRRPATYEQIKGSAAVAQLKDDLRRGPMADSVLVRRLADILSAAERGKLT